MIQKIIVFIFILSSFSFGFGQENIRLYTNFSHVPRARIIPHSDFRIKFINTSHLGDGNDNIDSKRIGSFDVGLFDWVDGGGRLVMTDKDFSYNLKLRILKESGQSLGLAIGIINANAGNVRLDYSGFNKPLDNKNSFFIVMGKTIQKFSNTHLTFGVGNGIFKSSEGISEYAYGFFGALEKNFGKYYLGLEFDGLKLSLGFGVHWTDNIVTAFQLRGIEDIYKGGSKSGVNSTGFVFGFNYLGTFSENKIALQKEQTSVLKDKIQEELKEIKDSVKNTEDSFKLTTNSLKAKEQSQIQTQDSLKLEIKQLETEIWNLNAEGRMVSSIVANRLLGHLRVSTKLFYQGDFNLAKEECIKAIELEPNIAIGHSKLGSIYHKLGNKRLAIKEWEKALEIDPLNVELKKFLEGYKK